MVAVTAPYHYALDMEATLLWYDIETFGTHSKWDRICQFAAIRTNDSFESVGDPIVAYCKIGWDYIPDPDSCLLTGLTPQYVNEEGICEAEFVSLIQKEMITPNTCVTGFNNLRFDDEFIRNLFYRNLYDPYKREYANGNSRWDILDLCRMAHDLRPDGLCWVHNEVGKPVFKLEELSKANGIQHEKPHDALSDVKATIALARAVRTAQPKLFNYYFRLRKKEEVRRILNLQYPQPLVHISGMFTSKAGCTSIVLPVSVHPNNPNVVITYDLRYSPESWINLPAQQIRRRIFTASDQLGKIERIHFKGVHLNRCPALSPIKTLTSDRADALEIDINSCIANARQLSERSDLVSKIRSVYEHDDLQSFKDPDLQIYSGGFFGDEDRAAFQMTRESSPEELVRNAPHFYDKRGPELFRRYLARNYFDFLPATEQQRWKSYCASRILAPEIDSVVDYGKFCRIVENRLARTDTPPNQKRILKALLEYADWIETNILR